MNASKEAQCYVYRNPHSQPAETLALLVLSLESRKKFALEKLYELDLERFEIALEILKEWRLDRYYACKSKLYDLSLHRRELAQVAENLFLSPFALAATYAQRGTSYERFAKLLR